MKKSLVALAVLGAFTSIASAQSSVTLYGRIDQNVTVQDPGKRATSNGVALASGKGGKATTKLNDGGVNGLGSSRIGFKGTEDLGSGLKAFFVLEAGVSPDSGKAGGSTTLDTASGSAFFNRGAYLGLSHATLGEIRLGRQETLSRENNVKINDISGENNFSIVESLQEFVASNASSKSTRPLFQNFGTRVDNGIRYTTPSFAGIQASAIVGLGERQVTTGGTAPNTSISKAANYRGLAVVYAAGPLALNAIYEDLSGGAARGSDDYNNVVTVGGSYDFGVAKVAAAYQHTNNLGGQLAIDSATGTLASTVLQKGIDVDAWNIGVAVPFNAFTFKAQYTGSTIDKKSSLPAAYAINTNGRSSLDQHKYGVSLQYALSKRTSVYASATERGGDDDKYFVGKTQFALGVGHTF